MKKCWMFPALVSVILIQTTAQALPLCSMLFRKEDEVSKLVNIDPVKQWLYWEQKSNFAIFRKDSEPIAIPISKVSKSDVNITFLDSASPELRDMIIKGDEVQWFKHPYNQAEWVPHFKDPSSGEILAYMTASRSVAVPMGAQVYTLKMGTDYPHGPKGQYQKAKAQTAEDILDGVNRMSYVERTDKLIGKDPQLILAKEVAMVADKKSGHGYLFRDVSFMNDGHYYLPALSIPYAGREIAKINGEDPDVFWKKHYAELLGRSKAKLLVRYGLQMETPNSQNMLIQLDANLRPTGVLVFRDISDTYLIEGVAKGLKESKVLEQDAKLGVENSNSIVPYWTNSAWRFDEAGENSFSAATLAEWGKVHNEAYKKEIERALNVRLNAIQDVDHNGTFNKFINSNFMQVKFWIYRKKLIEQQKLAHP